MHVFHVTASYYIAKFKMTNQKFRRVTDKLVILIVTVTLLLTLLILSVDASLGQGETGRKVSEREIFWESKDVEIDDESDVAVDVQRDKRVLPVDPEDKRSHSSPTMLFNDSNSGVHETLDMVYTNFTIEDLIVRMQEKYEYSTCWKYLEAAGDVQNKYFLYDTALVEPWEDSEEYSLEKQKKIKATQGKRFHMWGEPCNLENEREYWRQIFLVAENETAAYVVINETQNPPNEQSQMKGASVPMIGMQKIDGHENDPNEPTYLPFPRKEMMRRWNQVWLKYTTKQVCNPRLLLRCEPETETCACRSFGVGLSSVHHTENMVGLEKDFFTTRHYYDYFNNTGEVDENGDEIVERQTKSSGRCVVTANMPHVNRDAQIANPCDFFLPMIGECTMHCVENASCTSVNEIEKMEFQRDYPSNDPIDRIKNQRLHEHYHYKCRCDNGKRCRPPFDMDYGGAPRSTLPHRPEVILFLSSCLIILSSHINKFK